MRHQLKGLGVKRCLVVSDRGMVSADTREALEAAGFETLTGTRMRQVEEVQAEALSKRGRFTERASGLGGKAVQMEGSRYVVVHNPKQARKDATVRAEVVSRIEPVLEQIPAGKASVCALRHPLLKRFVRTLKDGTPTRNATKGREDARFDGKYVLRTTASDLTTEDVLSADKTLMRIAQGFRTIKSVLRLRPIYHHADHRITSHVKLCVLASLLVRHAEWVTGQSWEQIARRFRPLRVGALITEAGTVSRRSELTPEQRGLLKHLEIRPPQEIQKVELRP